LLKLGPALMVVRGMQSAEVEDAYRRAADLGIGLGDDAATFKGQMGPLAQRHHQKKDSART
jgi:hypothetical protein